MLRKLLWLVRTMVENQKFMIKLMMKDIEEGSTDHQKLEECLHNLELRTRRRAAPWDHHKLRPR